MCYDYESNKEYYTMKKNISFLALSVLLASCVTDSSVPIRSATRPAPYNETNFYDASYDDNNMVDAGMYQQPVAEQPNVADAELQPVAENKTSMMDEVNSVNATNNVDVNKTNFGAMGSYKIGNPYLIDGVSYYPHEDFAYSEIGMASWYGPDFHGGKTANGEVFDENKFTAAHRTLPMPCLVRVTNLENGVSVNVKVNDRGPYARDRIIDLSSAAADVLGIKQKGSVRVKVEILPEESRKLKDLAIASQNTDIYPPNIGYSSFAVQPQAKVEEPKMVKEPGLDNAVSAGPVPQQQAVVAPAPVPAPAVAPASSNATKASASGDYFVQVAAYSTYEKAEALKDKLVNIGTVKIFKSVVNGNTLYKVRLGEFGTKEEAEKARTAVTNAGITGSRVILKEDGAFKWYIK